MSDESTETGFWAAVADADTDFVVTADVAAALAVFSLTTATAADRRLDPIAGRATGAFVVAALFRCCTTSGITATFRAAFSGPTFAAAARGEAARACAEFDDAAGDDDALSAAATPHPAAIDAPIPAARTAPPSQPE
jgi:hypothetical protein